KKRSIFQSMDPERGLAQGYRGRHRRAIKPGAGFVSFRRRCPFAPAALGLARRRNRLVSNPPLSSKRLPWCPRSQRKSGQGKLPALSDDDYGTPAQLRSFWFGHRDEPMKATSQAEAVEAPPRIPIGILGVRFDNITLRETLSAIERMVASRRPHYVVT